MKKKIIIVLVCTFVSILGMSLILSNNYSHKSTIIKVEYKPINAYLATPENIRRAMKLAKSKK